MASSSFPSLGRLLACLALVAAVATCGEDRTPTAPDDDTAIAEATGTVTPLSSAGSITHTLLTSGNNTVNQRIYTTAAIAPAPNALITVAVMGHNSTAAVASPTLSGGGMTAWTEVATISFDAVATPHKRLTIYRAMSAAPGSGPLTITFSSSQSHCQWIVSRWDGVDITGVNGAGAIGQTGSTRGDAVNGLAVPLAAFGNANNVAYGVFGVRQNVLAVTPGTGFMEIAEQPSGESPLSDLQVEWAINDNTIDASWATLNGAALGVEIKAGDGGGGGGVSAFQSSVAVSSSSIAAGSETSTITVTVKDANDAPISGATVVLSATGTRNTLTQPAGPTDPNGVATGTLSSTVAEIKTISATANGTAITQTATVSVTAGAVSASQSSVVAAPTVITPGGTSTITVTAKDVNGNPIGGATVLLAATGSGSSITQPTVPTSTDGVATGTLTGTVEETILASATIDGTPIAQTATVQVIAQTAAAISHTLLTSGSNAVNQRVYTTAVIAPASQTLVTVAVLMRRSSGALSPTLTGGGMTAWEPVTSVDFDTQGVPTKRLTLFRAMSAAPGSGPLTITFSSSVSNAQWIVSQWDGVETSGANGSGAIAQTGTGRSDGATSLAVALAPFGNANDVAYGIVGVAKNGPIVTPAPGFTEIAETSSGESTALEAEWATNEPTVGASWTGLSRAGILAVEIKAGQSGPVTPVVSVDISPTSASIAEWVTVQLTATPRDGSGNPLTGRLVTWASSAEGVATVDATGLVTAVALGGATITAMSEGVSGTAAVTVTPARVAVVEVTPATTSVALGGTRQLTARPLDAAGNPLSGRVVTWGSSAENVATVDATGLVTAVAVGGATITATSEGVSGTAAVTVTTARSTLPNLKVAFIGDQDNGAAALAVLELIRAEGADLVLHQGDFDYSDNPTAWDSLITSVLGAGYPYFASVGNHDDTLFYGAGGYQEKLLQRLSRVTGASCTGDLGVNSACTYQGLFFVLSGAGTLGTGHEAYLRDQLTADGSVWRICSWHKNQREMQIGGKGSEVGWGPYEACRELGAIIATAHEHSYERTKTLVSTLTQTVDPAWTRPDSLRVAPGASFVFVSGLGGAGIRDQERCLPATYPYGCNGEWASVYTLNQNATHGALFIEFHVDGDPWKAVGYFKNIAGVVVDQFTVRSELSGTPLLGAGAQRRLSEEDAGVRLTRP